MNRQETYRYLKKYGRIDFLFKRWWTLHTEDPFWSIRSLYERYMPFSFPAGFGLIAYALLLFVQCQSRQADTNLSHEIRTDSIRVAYNQPEEYEIRLSDLADSIEYVALETTENSLVKLLNNITVTDKHILIKDGCGFLLFSREGKFVCRIGNKGQGPGEFVCGGNYDIDEERQRIYIWAIYEHKALVYDFSGKMVNAFTLEPLGENAHLMHFLVYGDAEYMAATVDNAHAVMSDTTLLINLKTKEYKKVNGYICGIDRKLKHAYLRRTYADRDSIFRIERDRMVFCHAVFQDKPEELDFFMSQLPLRINDRIFLLGNRQRERFTYESAWVHVTKRGGIVHYTATDPPPRFPALYSCSGQQFCRLEHDGLYQGIINDMDGGLSFIPRASYWGAFPETYGHTMATYYLPEEIFDYYENRPAGAAWASRLKEDDNPVIFIVHLKQ
jgi:hypothetical protein